MKTVLRLSLLFTSVTALLAITACNNGNGTLGSDSLDLSMPDSMGARLENVASGVRGEIAELRFEDSSFVDKAYRSNAGELALLQAGAGNGTNSRLKDEARKMIADHTTLKEQLQSFASQHGYTLPATDGTNEALNNLSQKAKGAEWDKAWVNHMEQEHKADIDAFERAESNVKDSSLHRIVTSTLPVLHAHLAHVQELQNALKP